MLVLYFLVVYKGTHCKQEFKFCYLCIFYYAHDAVLDFRIHKIKFAKINIFKKAIHILFFPQSKIRSAAPECMGLLLTSTLPFPFSASRGIMATRRLYYGGYLKKMKESANVNSFSQSSRYKRAQSKILSIPNSNCK